MTQSFLSEFYIKGLLWSLIIDEKMTNAQKFSPKIYYLDETHHSKLAKGENFSLKVTIKARLLIACQGIFILILHFKMHIWINYVVIVIGISTFFVVECLIWNFFATWQRKIFFQFYTNHFQTSFLEKIWEERKNNQHNSEGEYQVLSYLVFKSFQRNNKIVCWKF